MKINKSISFALAALLLLPPRLFLPITLPAFRRSITAACIWMRTALSSPSS